MGQTKTKREDQRPEWTDLDFTRETPAIRPKETPAPFGHFETTHQSTKSAWTPQQGRRGNNTRAVRRTSPAQLHTRRASAGVTASSALQLKTVQARGQGEAQRVDLVKKAAAFGVTGNAGQLPFFEQIQEAFGRYSVAGIQSFNDTRAEQANSAMGSLAYATGNAIAFKGSPDLHTAAHEAAHILQQAIGVSIPGGVGSVGDIYERHADEVADAVVQGRSAEPILDAFFGFKNPAEARRENARKRQEQARSLLDPSRLKRREQEAKAKAKSKKASSSKSKGRAERAKQIAFSKGQVAQMKSNPVQMQQGQDNQQANQTDISVQGGSYTKVSYKTPKIPLWGPFTLQISLEGSATNESDTGNLNKGKQATASQGSGTKTPKSGGTSDAPQKASTDSSGNTGNGVTKLEASVTAEVTADFFFFSIGVGISGSVSISLQNEATLKGDALKNLSRLIAFRSAGDQLKAIEKKQQGIVQEFENMRKYVENYGLKGALNDVKRYGSYYAGKNGPGKYKDNLTKKLSASSRMGRSKAIDRQCDRYEKRIRAKITEMEGTPDEGKLTSVRTSAKKSLADISKAAQKLTNDPDQAKRALEAKQLYQSTEGHIQSFHSTTDGNISDFSQSVGDLKGGFSNDPNVGVELSVQVFAKGTVNFSEAASGEIKGGRIMYGLSDELGSKDFAEAKKHTGWFGEASLKVGNVEGKASYTQKTTEDGKTSHAGSFSMSFANPGLTTPSKNDQSIQQILQGMQNAKAAGTGPKQKLQSFAASAKNVIKQAKLDKPNPNKVTGSTSGKIEISISAEFDAQGNVTGVDVKVADIKSMGLESGTFGGLNVEQGSYVNFKAKF